MDTYLNALVNHDLDSLPVTVNIKYTENGVRLNLGDGLWQTAMDWPTYRVDVIDEEAGAVGLLGKINEHGNSNWYAVRLKVEKGELISEIETLIARNISGGGGGPQFSPLHDEPHPLMMEPVSNDSMLSRSELAAIGNSYFTGLDTDNSAANVPFSPECQRRKIAQSQLTTRTWKKAPWYGWTAKPSSIPASRSSSLISANAASKSSIQ